jgi:hypothetical protein
MRGRFSPILPVLVIVGAYQFSLLGVGAYSFQDEVRYKKAVNALVELRGGHLRGWLTQIVALEDGRPGEAVVKMVPAALQFIPHAFGVTPANPVSLRIPTACNIIVSLGVVFLLFRMCLILCECDPAIAAAAAMFYGLLVNTSLYVRHLFPYDWSLCVFMGALWLVLSKRPTVALAALAGLFAASTVLIYPGYYLLCPLLGVALLARAPSPAVWASRARLAVAFASAVAAVFLAVEITSRSVGHSYLKASRVLTGTITLGSFDEGWLFVPRYLIAVERAAGVILVIGLACYGARFVSEIARGTSVRPIHWLVLSVILAWMSQATMAYQLHFMVLYGRLIHPWFVFLVLAAVDALAWIRRDSLRRVVAFAAVIAAAASWLPSAADYYRLAYPADVAYRLGIDTARVAEVDMPCEMDMRGRPFAYSSPPALNAETGYPYTNASAYLLVNFCFGWPAGGEYQAVRPPRDARLLFEGPHFLTFPAYSFEGFGPEDRHDLVARRYAVRVYSLSDSQRP